MQWRYVTPSLQEELDVVDAAFSQLPWFESNARDAFRWEVKNYLFFECGLLGDVLHEGPSAVILEDVRRGWRLEVQAGDGQAVTYW